MVQPENKKNLDEALENIESRFVAKWFPLYREHLREKDETVKLMVEACGVVGAILSLVFKQDTQFALLYFLSVSMFLLITLFGTYHLYQSLISKNKELFEIKHAFFRHIDQAKRVQTRDELLPIIQEWEERYEKGKGEKPSFVLDIMFAFFFWGIVLGVLSLKNEIFYRNFWLMIRSFF
jgi:hypothetical protein